MTVFLRSLFGTPQLKLFFKGGDEREGRSRRVEAVFTKWLFHQLILISGRGFPKEGISVIIEAEC